MGLLDSLKKMLGLSGTDENQAAAPTETPVDNQANIQDSTPADESNQDGTEGGM